mmetsp:Transcript_25853/g.53620  ORF Transcript_25853/g.53620 Transcript_25853/m.53620 type:complete len:86 (-) Transcript_25853:6-263(-)
MRCQCSQCLNCHTTTNLSRLRVHAVLHTCDNTGVTWTLVGAVRTVANGLCGFATAAFAGSHSGPTLLDVDQAISGAVTYQHGVIS